MGNTEEEDLKAKREARKVQDSTRKARRMIARYIWEIWLTVGGQRDPLYAGLKRDWRTLYRYREKPSDVRYTMGYQVGEWFFGIMHARFWGYVPDFYDGPIHTFGLGLFGVYWYWGRR